MIDKLTKNFIKKIIKEINNEENRKNIDNEILKPLFSKFTDRIYPYVSLLFIMYTLNLIIIIVILVLILLKKK